MSFQGADPAPALRIDTLVGVYTVRRRERPPGRPCVTTDRRYRVTTIVPFMPGWIVHMYRMTPGVVSFSLHVVPRVKVGDEANFGPDA